MKKVLKIVGIVVGVLVVLFAILFTVIGMSVNKLGGSKYDTEESLAVPSSTSLPLRSMKSNSSLGMEGTGMQEAEVPSEDSAAPIQADKKVIKNGNLTAKVERVDDAQNQISEIAKNNGGSIFSTNIYQSKNSIKSGTVIVKVPVANFEKTFSEIKKSVVLVVRESTSGQDVTEQYQDLETRIKNKQVEEEAYKKILGSAQKISDIIEVTQALSQVRGEIEAYQGQLKYLASQTDMSTISVSLSEDQDITVVDSWRPWQIAKDAVNSLIKLVQGFVSFLIVFVITLIPVAILYLAVIFIVFVIGRKIYRRFKKNKESGAPQV